MNLLIDKLPKKVNNISINSDFRTSILFELLMQDNKINDKDKILLMLNLYYPESSISKMQNNVENAINNILWFYKCGKNDELASKNSSQVNNKRKQIYSYEFDDQYIYSAFLEQYNIDLNSIKYLHWWKFKSMFNGLKEDTIFVKIMGYRSIDLNSISDKKQKEFYSKMQKMYALPDERTEEQKENDFANNLSSLF